MWPVINFLNKTQYSKKRKLLQNTILLVINNNNNKTKKCFTLNFNVKFEFEIFFSFTNNEKFGRNLVEIIRIFYIKWPARR